MVLDFVLHLTKNNKVATKILLTWIYQNLVLKSRSRTFGFGSPECRIHTKHEAAPVLPI